MPALKCPCGRWLSVPSDATTTVCASCGRTGIVSASAAAPCENQPSLAEAAVSSAVEHDKGHAASQRKPKAPAAAAGFVSSGSAGQEEPGVWRRMFEALLDPLAIRWLLSLGGTLAVVGLLIWLASKGVFANPRIQACGLGAGTLLLLASGCATVKKTRFQLAGMALTFLACAVAPLNLWFYQAQHLMTVDGHLWLAGMACSLLYVGTLMLLQRPVLLYAIQAGITLTALLLLADLHRFTVGWAGLLFVAWGAIAIHLERLCLAGVPPIDRARQPRSAGEQAAGERAAGLDLREFGPPLVWSGLVQMAAGLIAVLVGQISGWSPISPRALAWLIVPERLEIAPLLATGLWLVGSYATFYVALVPRMGNWLVAPATVCLLLAEMSGLMALNAPAEAIVLALAITAAPASWLATRLGERSGSSAALLGWAAVLMALLPVGLGYLLFLKGALPTFPLFGAQRPLTGNLAGVLAITFVSLSASAWGMQQQEKRRQELWLLAAAAFMLTVSTLLHFVGPMLWPTRLAILLVVPLGSLVSGLVRKSRSQGLVAIQLFLLSVLHLGYVAAWGLVSHPFPVAQSAGTLWLGLLSEELAVLFLLAAASLNVATNRWKATILSLAAAGPMAFGVIQCTRYLDAPGATVPLLLATGLVMMLLGRLQPATSRQANLLNQPGLLTLSGLSGEMLLLSMGVLVMGRGWDHLGDPQTRLSMGQVIVVGLGAALALFVTRSRRRSLAFKALGVCCGVTAVVQWISISALTPWQFFELLVVGLGILMLISGHVTRFREQASGGRDLLVDFALGLGSVLTLLPLIIAVVVARLTAGQSLPNELALVTLSLMMLASGVSWRLRATTLMGGLALGSYLILLVNSVLQQQEVTMGAYLGGAGLAVFLVGLILSFYRDRLLTLPDRIAHREGVFQLLNWR